MKRYGAYRGIVDEGLTLNMFKVEYNLSFTDIIIQKKPQSAKCGKAFNNKSINSLNVNFRSLSKKRFKFQRILVCD